MCWWTWNGWTPSNDTAAFGAFVFMNPLQFLYDGPHGLNSEWTLRILSLAPEAQVVFAQHRSQAPRHATHLC
jgi:hypothetical protein